MRLRVLEAHRHIIIIIFAIVISFGWVFVAALWYHSPADGGRGGAIAVALSLGSLFLNRPYGEEIFRLMTTERESFIQRVRLLKENKEKNYEGDLDHTEMIISALATRFNIEVYGQEKQNLFMAISAAIGTIVWGFGDVFSGWLMKS